jgi:hypothetical protein
MEEIVEDGHILFILLLMQKSFKINNSQNIKVEIYFHKNTSNHIFAIFGKLCFEFLNMI